MPWTNVSITVRRSKTGKKKPKSLQQLPQNFSFLERLLRHLVFYHQRFPSAGSASPFCPPPALWAAAGPGGGGPGPALGGPVLAPAARGAAAGFWAGPNPSAVGRWLPPGPRRQSRFHPSRAAPGLGGRASSFQQRLRPPPTQPLTGSGGAAASPSPPGRALRRGEGPRAAPPPTAFSRRALSPYHLPPPPPGPNGRARPQRLCATRSVPLPYGEGEEKEGGQFHRFKAGCNLPSPHGGMGAGGKGGERIGRVKFKGEREGPEKEKEKEKGELPGRAAPPARAAAGMRRAVPPPPSPLFPPGMTAEAGDGEAEHPLRRRAVPTMASAGRGGRAAERGTAAAAPSAVWARRGFRRQEEKLRGREPGGSAPTSRPPCPEEEEAVAMVGAPRGDALSPVRTRERGWGWEPRPPCTAPSLTS